MFLGRVPAWSAYLVGGVGTLCFVSRILELFVANYTVRLADGSSFPVRLEDSPLGRGGEGSVYGVASVGSSALGSAGDLVGKVYHQDESKRAAREAKCLAMVSSVPQTDSIVWNLGNLYDSEGKFAGFLMKKLQMDVYRSFMEVAHTRHRRKRFPQWSVMHALLMARNLAVAIDAVHTAGHMVGDVNESNVLVAKDATVRIVDADSVQISEGSTVYPCVVGKPEFTAPEISKGSYAEERNRRTVATDMYAFVVMLFNALMGRAHPTACNYKGEHKDVTELIDLGVYPTFVPKLPRGFSKLDDLEYEAIPSRVHALIGTGLSGDPAKRPTFDAVIEVFDGLFERDADGYVNLKQCSVSPLHWWDVRDGATCPMCRFASRNPDADIWGEDKSAEDMSAILAKAGKKKAKRESNAKKATPGVQPPSLMSVLANKKTVAPPVIVGQGTQGQAYQGATPQQGNTAAGQGASADGGRLPGEPPELEKISGRLAVVDSDGASAPRPPIMELVKGGSYAIAFDALSAENPRSMPWVSSYRAVPIWWVSLLASLIVALGWWFAAPSITTWAVTSLFPEGVPEHMTAVVVGFRGIIWGIPCSALLVRFLSGLWLWWKRAREVKSHGYGAVAFESPVQTVLGVVMTSLVSGVLIPVFLLISVLSKLVYAIIEGVFSSSKTS